MWNSPLLLVSNVLLEQGIFVLVGGVVSPIVIYLLYRAKNRAEVVGVRADASLTSAGERDLLVQTSKDVVALVRDQMAELKEQNYELQQQNIELQKQVLDLHKEVSELRQQVSDSQKWEHEAERLKRLVDTLERRALEFLPEE